MREIAIAGVLAVVAGLGVGLMAAYTGQDFQTVAGAMLIYLFPTAIALIYFTRSRKAAPIAAVADKWSAFDFYREQLKAIITTRNAHWGDMARLAEAHGELMATIRTTLRLKGRVAELADFDDYGLPRYVPGGYDHSSPENLYRSFLAELEGRVRKLRDDNAPPKK